MKFIDDHFKGKIGEYEILEQIGEGGMGIVFKANHVRLDRIVAIKVFNLNSEGHLARFKREIEITAKFDHPNFVKVYDAGIHEDYEFYVMEYIKGENIENLIKDKKLSKEEILDYFLVMMNAFDYAHQKGIVHRDIKPSNILVDEENNVKILDMGLAKDWLNDKKLTNHGEIYGSADYMSPEQALDSGSVDHRADIYSLGCVLFFMLTGKPVFGGDGTISSLMLHQTQTPPYLTDPHLNQIFQKMVSKNPRDRYNTLQDTIDDFLSEDLRTNFNLKRILMPIVLILFFLILFLILFSSQMKKNELNAMETEVEEMIESTTKAIPVEEGKELEIIWDKKEPKQEQMGITDINEYKPDVIRDRNGRIILDMRDSNGWIRNERGYIIGRQEKKKNE